MDLQGVGLSFELLFVSLLAMVLSEYQKRLEEVFFCKFRHFQEIAEIILLKKILHCALTRQK